MVATAHKLAPAHTSPNADVDALPPNTRFVLGDTLTPIQRAFFAKHGFIIFAQVATTEELGRMDRELGRLQREWLAEGRKKVFGIPLFVGRDFEQAPFIQRFAFASVFSDAIRDFVLDARFEPIRRLVGDHARVGHRERDGVVVNRSLNVPGSQYKALGWHTDGLRDLFYLRKIRPQLNVGLHFDRVHAADGGLRIIPGSHQQGMLQTIFHKRYFVDHKPDPQEIAVETEPGDLTVHDGRAWHRAEPSPHVGPRSLRRTMYVPYLTDGFKPKDDKSATPPYHYVGMAVREARRRAFELRERLGLGPK